MKSGSNLERVFAKGEFADVARDLDINETYPEKIVQKARELDLIGLFIPEAYGGPGLGFLEQAMVLEEFWKVDPGIGQQLSSISFGAEELILFGTEEQKKKWLPPLFEGNAIMGFAITEPDAGCDVTSAATTAVLHDGKTTVEEAEQAFHQLGAPVVVVGCQLSAAGS